MYSLREELHCPTSLPHRQVPEYRLSDAWLLTVTIQPNLVDRTRCYTSPDNAAAELPKRACVSHTVSVSTDRSCLKVVLGIDRTVVQTITHMMNVTRQREVALIRWRISRLR